LIPNLGSPTHISDSLVTILWVKNTLSTWSNFFLYQFKNKIILNFVKFLAKIVKKPNNFVVVGSGIWHGQKSRSGIQDKHPGSATLILMGNRWEMGKQARGGKTVLWDSLNWIQAFYCIRLLIQTPWLITGKFTVCKNSNIFFGKSGKYYTEGIPSSRRVPSHRLNMELDLQSLFGLHVYSCTHWPTPHNPPPPHPPAFGLIYCTRALLVSQDRRHLFVTPCPQLSLLRCPSVGFSIAPIFIIFTP
jgi:hypothetical protein